MKWFEGERLESKTLSGGRQELLAVGMAAREDLQLEVERASPGVGATRRRDRQRFVVKE